MAQICGRCRAESPDGKRYCADCGNSLESAADARLREQVRTILKAEFIEQKYVATETAAAIAGQLMDWSKTFAFFVAIPIAAILGLLLVMGISNFDDARKKIAVELANVNDLQVQDTKLQANYAALKTRYSNTQKLADHVYGLQTTVDGLLVSTVQLRLVSLNRSIKSLNDPVDRAKLDRIADALGVMHTSDQTFHTELGHVIMETVRRVRTASDPGTELTKIEAAIGPVLGLGLGN